MAEAVCVRWARRWGLVVPTGLAGMLLGLAVSGPAAAHATLLGTDPVDGAILSTAPAQVSLTFDEPVELRPGAVRLLDAAGAEMPVSARTVDTRVVVDVPARGLANGTYVVVWRVISADAHPVAGGFTFSVGAPSASGVAVPVAEPTAGLRLVRQVTEAVGYAGVLGSVGLMVFGLVFLVPGGGGVRVRRRLRTTGWWFAAAAAAAMVAAIPVTSAWQDGAGLGALADVDSWRSGLGSDTALVSLLVVAGLAVMVAAAMAPGRRQMWVVAGLAGAALALGSFAVVGHTRTFGPPVLVLAADVLHVSAAAVWFGGLVGLTLLLGRSSDATPVAAAETLAGFSRVAAGLVVLLGAAGGVLGWRILNSWSALFDTSYGLVLMVKVSVALVVLGIAGINRYKLLPRIRGEDTSSAWPLLRRAVRAEAVLLVLIVAATGVLVTQSPVANRPATASPDVPASARWEAALGTGRMVVRLTPVAVGVNALELTIVDAAGQPIEPVAPPEIRVTLPERRIGPLDRPVSRIGPGRYEAVADFPLPGAWLMEVSVRTAKFENPIARITVTIP